jgi:hypothetical protein
MKVQHLDYDRIAEIYDLYVTADYDIQFFVPEIKFVKGPVLSFMEIIGEENQRAALAAVFKCLAPGGRFICTLHNPAIRRKQVDGLLHLVGQFPTEDGTLVVSGFEQGGNPVVSRQQFFELFDVEGRLLEKRLLQMKFAFVEKDEFEQMAQSVGFRAVQLYGNYDRAPFNPAQSPVMIWVLEKHHA